MLCLFKVGRKITARYDVNDLYTNGILDLGLFFPMLETQAGMDTIGPLSKSE